MPKRLLIQSDVLPNETEEIVQLFRKIILKEDKNIIEKKGRIMSIEDTLNYYEDGMFKYGLSVTKNYITFHSIVMYAYPQLMDELKKKLTKVKFQKGCINFKGISEFPLETFREHIIASSKIDFKPVIEFNNKRNGNNINKKNK